MIKWYVTKLAERDILTIFCTLAAIGIVALICDICLLIKRKYFGEKYLLKYEQWIHNPSDEECYQRLLRWLRRNSTRMMDEMGGNRVINFYDPHSVNQGMLERHIGKLDYLVSKKLWQLINPFAWLPRTLRLILLDIPLWMFRSIELRDINFESKIRNHSLFSITERLISFIGTLASIVALFFILSEWDPFVKFWNRIFG